MRRRNPAAQRRDAPKGGLRRIGIRAPWRPPDRAFGTDTFVCRTSWRLSSARARADEWRAGHLSRCGTVGVGPRPAGIPLDEIDMTKFLGAWATRIPGRALPFLLILLILLISGCGDGGSSPPAALPD